MVRQFTNFMRRMELDFWRRSTHKIEENQNFKALRDMRRHSAKMRLLLNDVDRRLYEKLARPLVGANPFVHPVKLEWWFRPEPWRVPVFPESQTLNDKQHLFGPGVSVFSESDHYENIMLHQNRNTLRSDLNPFRLTLDVFRYSGEFISVIVDFEEEIARKIDEQEIITVHMTHKMLSQTNMFMRLNVARGPNVASFTADVTERFGELSYSFELQGAKLEGLNADRVWLEVIFGHPNCNQFIIRDLVLSGRKRAEM